MRLAAALEQRLAFDRRRYMRQSVQIGGSLGDNSRASVPITVTDLSTSGCGIETTTHLEQDSRVWVKLPGLASVPCRVVWFQDGRAGLNFDNPMHPAVVDHICGQCRN
jgi:hypothetical protein